jgi:hypothetical protein
MSQVMQSCRVVAVHSVCDQLLHSRAVLLGVVMQERMKEQIDALLM